MKNFFETNPDLIHLIKFIEGLLSLFCAYFVLLSLGLSFGGLGNSKMDSYFVNFVIIMNYQLFLLMIIFLTLTIVLPRWMIILIGGLVIISPITFWNYQDGLGFLIHGLIVLVGIIYIVSKFYEDDFQKSDFWLFDSLTVFLIGINGVNTFVYFNLLNAYFSPDFYHLMMNLGLIITMIIAPILIGILLFIPVKKWLEYLIGFCLLFSAIMFLLVTDDLISPSIITGAIALIFLSYITFFQNEKYQNQ